MLAPTEPPRSFLISDLCKLLEGYLERDQVQKVYEAYLFSAEAHDGQYRLSGEPYIYHPVAVARILAEMRMDAHTLVAALLHDVIEDTRVDRERIAQVFGEEVAALVDGVSKLTQVPFESRAEAQAANFRKMLLAMVDDIRVILIKLADRLHNMRTLGVMAPEKRRRIARETLEIYAPIAQRLGMNALRLELEDLGFAALYPYRYQVLKRAVRKAKGNRKELKAHIEETLRHRLQQEGVDAQVLGREKHLYSIYQKMRRKKLPFKEVFDLYAFRIIVDKVDTCYRTLGIVHNLYKPVPGRFKDYIAIPKANGYQSLHTLLIGPHGGHVEIQIRTVEMDRVAEAGIAAHWSYKVNEDPGNAAEQKVREWLKGILEMQKSAGNSLEFLEHIKVDLFPEEVYVFTPQGEIKVLPKGATVVDFAYAVHTDIGATCVSAKIDHHRVSLHTVLHNGQTVQVFTSPTARPHPAWLNFVVTAKARAHIRHYLKNLQREEARKLGERLLKEEFAGLPLRLEDLSQEALKPFLDELKLPSLDALYEDIGFGKRLAPLVAKRWIPSLEGKDKAEGSPRSLAIEGTEGMVVSYAKCCRPIPGDAIAGYFSAGKGLVVHTTSCRNIAGALQVEKCLNLQWAPQVKGEFPVDLRVEVTNRRGVLASIAATMAEMEANIENVGIMERDGIHTTLSFTVAVRNRKHLAAILREVRRNPMVMRIQRAK